jgi:hypothetical protein
MGRLVRRLRPEPPELRCRVCGGDMQLTTVTIELERHRIHDLWTCKKNVLHDWLRSAAWKWK